MDSYTPAKDIRAKDLEANASALRKLLDELDNVNTVLDVRYGLGGWAREVRKRWPQARITGYELDKKTYDQAWEDSRVTLINDNLKKWRQVDLLLADFNTVTALNRRELDELMRIARGRHFIFTDVCCSKLHLNFRSYGLGRASLKDYWKGFEIEGYKLVAWRQEHYAASTGLFKRKAPQKRG